MLVDDDHAGGIAPVAVDPELPCKARWAAAAMEVMSTPQSTWSTPLVKSHSHVFRGIRSVVPVSPAVGTGGGLVGSDQLIKTAMDALLREKDPAGDACENGVNTTNLDNRGDWRLI